MKKAEQDLRDVFAEIGRHLARHQGIGDFSLRRTAVDRGEGAVVFTYRNTPILLRIELLPRGLTDSPPPAA